LAEFLVEEKAKIFAKKAEKPEFMSFSGQVRLSFRPEAQEVRRMDLC
jgi:hypothetical protein